MKLTAKISFTSFWILAALFFCFETHLARASDEPSESSFHFLQGEVGLDAAYEAHSSSTYTGIVRYTPDFHVDHTWAIGLDLGVSDFKYSDTSHTAVVEYAVSGRYRSQDLSLKIYAGAQSWTKGPYKTAFMFGPEFAYHFERPLALVIDQIFLSYTPVFEKIATIHEVALGVGISF